MRLDVSVLIPSVSAGPQLAATIEALLAGAGSATAEAVIADNGLPAGTLKALGEAGATVVSMGGNRGFGAAVNAAAHAASGRVLVVTNDDVEPLEGFVGRLAAPILAGRADVAAGVLLMAEDPGRVETAGLEIDAVLGAYDHLHALPAARLGPGPAPLGPCGGAAAYSRETFLSLGGYDEGFFAYCEDVDLALRLRAAGARIELVTDARALHATSASTGYASLRKAEMVGESRGYLVRKYGVMRRPAAALRIMATEGLVSLELARRHRSLRPARARVSGYLRGARTAQVPDLGPGLVPWREGFRRRYARSTRTSAG